MVLEEYEVMNKREPYTLNFKYLYSTACAMGYYYGYAGMRGIHGLAGCFRGERGHGTRSRPGEAEKRNNDENNE